MSSKYPLEAVRTLRHAQADAAAGVLGERERRVRVAAGARDRAQAELEQARAAYAAGVAAERARLESGFERAGDLRRAEEARKAELQRIARLDAERQARQRALDEAEAARALAARELEAALGRERAVEEHREHWSRELAQAAEQRDEEAALEQWNGERFGSSRR